MDWVHLAGLKWWNQRIQTGGGAAASDAMRDWQATCLCRSKKYQDIFHSHHFGKNSGTHLMKSPSSPAGTQHIYMTTWSTTQRRYVYRLVTKLWLNWHMCWSLSNASFVTSNITFPSWLCFRHQANAWNFPTAVAVHGQIYFLILFNGSNRAPDDGSGASFRNALFLARNERTENIQHIYELITRMSITVSTKSHLWMLTWRFVNPTLESYFFLNVALSDVSFLFPSLFFLFSFYFPSPLRVLCILYFFFSLYFVLLFLCFF